MFSCLKLQKIEKMEIEKDLAIKYIYLSMFIIAHGEIIAQP